MEYGFNKKCRSFILGARKKITSEIVFVVLQGVMTEYVCAFCIAFVNIILSVKDVYGCLICLEFV